MKSGSDKGNKNTDEHRPHFRLSRWKRETEGVRLLLALSSEGKIVENG